MVLILVEGCIAPHVYSESYLGEAAAVALYSVAYIIWNQITFEVNGCWPYTFQEQLDSPVLHTAYVVVLFLFIGPSPAAHARASVAGVTPWALRSGAVFCRAALQQAARGVERAIVRRVPGLAAAAVRQLRGAPRRTFSRPCAKLSWARQDSVVR